MPVRKTGCFADRPCICPGTIELEVRDSRTAAFTVAAVLFQDFVLLLRDLDLTLVQLPSL